MEKQDSKDSGQKENEPIGELIHIGQNLIGQEHYFAYVSATEVKCTKCPLGYPISLGTEIKDGHIFIHGEKVL